MCGDEMSVHHYTMPHLFLILATKQKSAESGFVSNLLKVFMAIYQYFENVYFWKKSE